MQTLLDRTCVVIVAFNSSGVLKRALDSIPAGPEIVVVDNASTDDSARIAQKSGVRCIRNEVNIGFGAASNIGAASFRREYILFLNPDAVLQDGALETMVSALDRHRDAGAAGPRLVDDTEHTQWRYKSILHPESELTIRPSVEPEGDCCVPLLTGAALLCRRSVFEAIGGFDENIFLYYEDDDISLRLTRAGSSLIYVPGATVYHAFGRSSGAFTETVRFKYKHMLRSKAYVSEKYGLAFRRRNERLKAFQRLVFAIVKFDRHRRAAAMGTLDGLSSLSSQSFDAPVSSRKFIE